MHIQVGDHVPEALLRLVEHVASPLGPIRDAIVAQVASAVVTAVSGSGIDLEVPERLPALNLPDGPTPGRALVYSGGEISSEVEIWIRDGHVVGLEQPWYTAQPPTGWPTKEQVHLT